MVIMFDMNIIDDAEPVKKPVIPVRKLSVFNNRPKGRIIRVIRPDSPSGETRILRITQPTSVAEIVRKDLEKRLWGDDYDDSDDDWENEE